MMRISGKKIAVMFLAVMTSCTDPGETTGVAAATGGVIGAGLGAIIGSQTGDPGSGLVIGTVAGASTGALVGNALEAQEEGIRAQDEAIERNDRIIASQRRELEELRRMGQDNVSMKDRIRNNLDRSPAPHAAVRQPAAAPMRYSGSQVNAVPVYRAGKLHEPGTLQEKDIAVAARPPQAVAPSPVLKANSQADSAYGSYGWHNRQAELEPIAGTILTLPGEGAVTDGAVTGSPAALPKKDLSPECVQAETETAKAKEATQPADKLFHYRRALRLCPGNPEYHNGLGELYISLNRKNDAEFEFKEALSVDPGFEPARRNLQSVREMNANRF